MPPLRLKRIPFLSKLPILINSWALIILGFNGLNNLNILYFLKFVQDFGEKFDNFFLLGGLFLFSCLLAINFIDIKDYEGDKKEKIKTLPVLMGLARGKLLIGGGFLMAYVFAGLLIGNQIIFWLSVFLGLIQFYFVNRKKYQEWPIFAVYLASLIVLFVLILKF